MRRRILALAVLAIVAAVVSGCRRHAGHDAVAFRWTEELPPGSTLHVRGGSGSISLSADTSTRALVTASRSWRRGRARDIEFQVTRSGNTNDVYVCAMWRASGRCDASGYRGKQVDSFLSMFSLFNRKTDASADFVIAVPPGVAVDAKTTDGDVIIVGAKAGVVARTVNGSVTARDVAGRLNLATTNGNVWFSAVSVDGADTIRAVTARGAVHGELPASTAGEFSLSADNGSVRSEFAIPNATSGSSRRQHRLAGRIGDTDRYVRLHALAGSVVLVKTAGTAAR